MLQIELYMNTSSVTIYFSKDGGIRSAKNYATRVANLLKYKVTDIYIRYQNNNNSILDGAGLYTLANKRGDKWENRYENSWNRFKIKP